MFTKKFVASSKIVQLENRGDRNNWTEFTISKYFVLSHNGYATYEHNKFVYWLSEKVKIMARSDRGQVNAIQNMCFTALL